MGKQLFRNVTFLTLFMILSQILFPIANVFASSNSNLPPSNLAVQHITPDDVKLSWDSVFGATGYNVYEIKDGQLILHGMTTSTSYTQKDLSEGSYRFVVSTLSSDGESGPSAPVSFDIVYPEMMAPETLSNTIRNGNDIVLNWGASQYAEQYHIYQIAGDGEKTLLTSVTARTYTISNVSEGKYTYAVSAGNSLYGESSLSNPVHVEVVYPTMTAPSNFTYTLANGSDVTLKWNSVSYATDYNVYQIVNGEKVLKSTVTGTTLKFSNMSAGDHAFEVRSNSSRFGESAEGSQLTVSVSDIIMAAPNNFEYMIQNINDIVLTWESVPYATNYKIYQLINGEKVLKSTVTNTSVKYSYMASGDYDFEIHSFSDRYGESSESSKVSLTIETETMEAPINASYKILNGNDIVLNWDSVANANSYKVYQVENGAKVLKSTVSGTSVTYPNRPEGEYQYEVHSFSTRFGESPESRKLDISLLHPTMEPPKNVEHVMKNATDFTLSWDSASYATSYKVYQIIDGQKVLKNTLSGQSVTYTKMAPGEYEFIVYAFSPRFGESSEGTPVKVTLDGQSMEAPTDLTYSINNGNDISLKWSSVQYANSYNIYQVKDGEKVLSRNVTGTAISFPNAAAGEYHYAVHSVSTLLGESPEGVEVTISLVHPTMEAPKNFASKVQNGNDVVLTWEAVPYATSYKVYELINGQKELKRTVSSLSTILSNELEGQHTYVVHSVSNRFGESSEGSLVYQAVGFPAMEKPSNFTYTIVNGNDIALKWDATAYATNYNVYQMIDGEKVLVRSVTGTSTRFNDMPEGEYHYIVHSNSTRYGESPEGSKVSVEIVHPIMQSPENVTNSINNGNDIVLRWKAATYATAYNVYRIIDGQPVLERTVTGTAVSFINMPEGDYEYVVHAYSNRFGESPNGSSISLTLTWPTVQPPELTGTVFNANNMTLTWPAAMWANEYRLYKITNNNRQLIYKGTARSFKVYNLTEETHSFEVTAYSTRFGESTPSNRITETIVYPIMEPPVASLNLLNETSARISWDFVTYANGYNIYEIIDGESVLVAEKVNNLSYTITNMSYANHEYYVTSYSNSFGESDRSNIVLAKLIVDTEAPVTSIEAPSDWVNQNVVVTLSATDDETGVANTYYSLNDSAFVEGTTFNIDEEGVHKVSFYSVDKVGNTEEIQTIEVKIDKTGPDTTSNIQTAWSKEAVEVELTATDSKSGVAATYFAVNGSEYDRGTTFTISEEGEHAISHYSVDNAGNFEKVNVEFVKIDKTAPIVSLDLKEEYALGTELELLYHAEDNVSGIATETMTVNNHQFDNGDVLTLNQPGIYTIKVDVEDNAGWVTTIEKEIVVYILADLEVLPKVIIDNKGVFTVKVNLPAEFNTNLFELDSVTLNGNKAISKSAGHENQAQKGQFKFNREDFDWSESEKLLEFRGMLGDHLVVGYATVKVQLNKKK
ncbi:OmpL47-type beta-barrel domain-containing protein [Halalkalibacter urbisdiaboli]|uniref:OmpL47-type beta-barrel domain-containing protein n=1 Tax=Halalkalibacter urbisdiaboli TaxID=1960589 RepID=UPI000B432A0E|nr:hypothetical protein [Halalkalibacter urbisdiaboli]